MGTITRPNTFASGDTIIASEVNDDLDTIYADYSGSISNANIDASAAIAESKLSFNTSTGHDHDGTDSKAIPRGFAFGAIGEQETGTSVTPVLIALASQTITKAYLNIKTAPVGADFIVDININGTSIWATTQANRVTISDGDTTGTQTSFDTTSLTEGDIITIDIDQVGSGTAGSDLTITLKA